jgi:hypothetical protein
MSIAMFSITRTKIPPLDLNLGHLNPIFFQTLFLLKSILISTAIPYHVTAACFSHFSNTPSLLVTTNLIILRSLVIQIIS